jgi:arylsulfatase A-like enzyme
MSDFWGSAVTRITRLLSELAAWLGVAEAPFERRWLGVAIAIGVGIFFGWLEALHHFVFRNNPVFLVVNKVSPGIFWVAPLVTAGLTGAIAVLLTLPRFVFRSWPATSLAVLSSAFLGTYGVATLANKIDKGAAAILALGVATVAWRLVRRMPLEAVAKSAVALMVAAVAVIGVAAWIQPRVTERLSATVSAPSPNLPNVIVIVMDTVRGDHLSLDGYPRQTTPNLDRWAAEGTVFDNAWSSSSWTMPAHASLLTGRPTYEHGADRKARLDDRLPVLPEVLAQSGYSTGAFIANNIWIIPGYGFDRGFQWFAVHTPYSDGSRTVWGRKLYSTLEIDLGMHQLPVRKSAATVNADLIEWVDRHRDRPFFALLNYFDAHDPYYPPPEFSTRFTGAIPDAPPDKKKYTESINAYDGSIAYIDAQIGELRRQLERRNLANGTVMIVTSDHGEGLGDHNEPQHGKNLHRSVSRVPLIAIGPGVKGGQHIRSAVSVEQVPATVVAMLQLARQSTFPGPSLFAADAQGAESPVLSELKEINGDVVAKSLMTSRWQYIWNATGSREELYDLDADPRELQDVAEAQESRDIVHDFRRRLRTIFPDLAVKQDATTIR